MPRTVNGTGQLLDVFNHFRPHGANPLSYRRDLEAMQMVRQVVRIRRVKVVRTAEDQDLPSHDGTRATCVLLHASVEYTAPPRLLPFALVADEVVARRSLTALPSTEARQDLQTARACTRLLRSTGLRMRARSSSGKESTPAVIEGSISY